MKQYLKLLILLVVLWSIALGIYKDPSKLFDVKVQDQLLQTADKIDTTVQDIKNSTAQNK